jgi:phosphatidylglycerol lysyltransferase
MKLLLRNLGSIVGVCLFAAAVFVLHHELKNYSYRDVVMELRQTPRVWWLVAAGLTILNYTVLTLSDSLALRYISHPIIYRKLALASFIGYAFSHNTTIIGGSAARYRIYSSLGLSAGEVARVVVFCGLTFWLGFFTLSGIALLVAPQHIPQALHLPIPSVRPLGVLFLAVAGSYFVATLVKRTPLRTRSWEFSFPSIRLSLSQLGISSLDWTLAAGVLYVLLPAGTHLTFPRFLESFLLAQAAGLLSYIPGGLGVFETVIVILLGDFTGTSGLVGSLLLYRLTYYLLPLGLASILLAGHELLAGRERVRRYGLVLGRWGAAIAPNLFAIGAYVAGAILLFSGALPAVRGRIGLLRDLLPLPAIEISHFLASLTGAALLLLARGLQRRLDAAYHLTLVLLAAGIVFSLLKGLDYEEATILAVMLLALLPCREEFHRKASLIMGRFTLGWIILIAATLLSAAWLGMFSYKHVEYSHELWWRFAFHGDAPRFLRATAGAIVLVLLYGLAKLLAPARPKPVVLSGAIRDTIEAIVRDSPRTYANLALLGDKEFVLSENNTAFIMYGIEGRSWITVGDPVGPEDQWEDLIWRYVELSDTYGGQPVFYQVEAPHLHWYTELGLSFLKLGEEARVDLTSFSLEGGSRKGLRHSHNKAVSEGCTFSILPAQEVPGVIHVLKDISDAWLTEKHTSEKRFSLGFFDPLYLSQGPVAVVHVGRRIVGFANLWLGAGKNELSIDLMRYLPDSPPDIMDYLFIELLSWGHEQGYEWFNFGMAPLSGLESRAAAPFWSKAGALLFQHGEHFYNFQGLRQYKEKFDPQWRPMYLVCRGGLTLPRVLANVATLTSGGIREVVAK